MTKVGFLFLMAAAVACLCVWVEPSWAAYKIEKIGGGVAGSNKDKIEFLQIVAYVSGSILIIAGILNIVTHNKNAQQLNYTVWKPSAIFNLLAGTAFFVIAIFYLDYG